jgi:hypothetical protein
MPDIDLTKMDNVTAIDRFRPGFRWIDEEGILNTIPYMHLEHIAAGRLKISDFPSGDEIARAIINDLLERAR